MRRVVATLGAGALAIAPACKKEAPASDAVAGAAASPAPTSDAKTDAVGPDSPSTPSAPAAHGYPAALADVLALVPKSAQTFFVVRDPAAFLSGTAWLFEAERELVAATLTAVEAKSKTDDIARARQFFANYGALATTLAGGLRLDKGAVFYETGGAGVLLVAADDPAVIGKALTLVGLDDAASKLQCRAMSAAAGIVACSDTATALDAFAPGNAAAERREQLAKALPGIDLEHANVAGFVQREHPIAFTIETSPGLLEIDVQGTGAADDARQFFVPVKPTILDAVAAGSTFAWGNLDPAALESRTRELPAMFANVAKSVTGEYLYTMTNDPTAMVVLVGTSDPTPFRGALAMAMLGLGEAKKPLPDGGSMQLALENVDVGGSPVQVVHASVSDRPELAQLATMGMSPDAFAFAAGKSMAFSVGADASIVGKVAALSGSGPSAELLSSLPPELARALGAGEVGLAVHIALDGLQTADMRKAMAAVVASVPATPGGPSPELLGHALDLFAPVSSISGWVTWTEIGAQVHVAVQAFSDPATEHGQAARVALADVARGEDPARTYGALATRFPDSPRSVSYRMRAGLVPGATQSAMAAAFLAGVVAAIAIPAFVKYTERAKAAAAAK